MLQVCVDGSGTGDPRALILAGYVASPETWLEFSKDWKSHLDDLKLPRFKMNEMVNREEIAASFYRIIERHNVIAAISLTISTADLRKVVREIVPPSDIEAENLENPYYFAVKSIIGGLAALQTEIGIAEPVDFIFDDESEKGQLLSIWPLMKAAMPTDVIKMIGGTPTFRDDEQFMPLQAADLYAWWVRKWHLAGRRDRFSVSLPWSIKRKIDTLHMDLTESELRKSFTDAARSISQRRWLQKQSEGTRMTLPDPSLEVPVNQAAFSPRASKPRSSR
jgi:hypothetical protein